MRSIKVDVKGSLPYTPGALVSIGANFHVPHELYTHNLIMLKR
jgi:hypothetical protein